MSIFLRKNFSGLGDNFYPGRLFGTTKVAASPDAPVGRRLVQLFIASNALGVAFPNATYLHWCRSDDNGHWEVRNLNPNRKYHVIAYDPTGQYDPVIKMNLVPTVD